MDRVIRTSLDLIMSAPTTGKEGQPRCSGPYFPEFKGDRQPVFSQSSQIHPRFLTRWMRKAVEHYGLPE